jgi:hypothetical protein
MERITTWAVNGCVLVVRRLGLHCLDRLLVRLLSCNMSRRCAYSRPLRVHPLLDRCLKPMR